VLLQRAGSSLATAWRRLQARRRGDGRELVRVAMTSLAARAWRRGRGDGFVGERALPASSSAIPFIGGPEGSSVGERARGCGQRRLEDFGGGERGYGCGKKLFAVRLQSHEFAVPSQFLESNPLLDDNFPCFEVIKWT
jgi:hypothetical protein